MHMRSHLEPQPHIHYPLNLAPTTPTPLSAHSPPQLAARPVAHSPPDVSSAPPGLESRTATELRADAPRTKMDLRFVDAPGCDVTRR